MPSFYHATVPPIPLRHTSLCLLCSGEVRTRPHAALLLLVPRLSRLILVHIVALRVSRLYALLLLTSHASSSCSLLLLVSRPCAHALMLLTSHPSAHCYSSRLALMRITTPRPSPACLLLLLESHPRTHCCSPPSSTLILLAPRPRAH